MIPGGTPTTAKKRGETNIIDTDVDIDTDVITDIDIDIDVDTDVHRQ